MTQTDDERRAYGRGYNAGLKAAEARVRQMSDSWIGLQNEHRELVDAVEAYCLAVESKGGAQAAYKRMRAALNKVHGDDIVSKKLRCVGETSAPRS